MPGGTAPQAFAEERDERQEQELGSQAVRPGALPVELDAVPGGVAVAGVRDDFPDGAQAAPAALPGVAAAVEEAAGLPGAAAVVPAKAGTPGAAAVVAAEAEIPVEPAVVAGVPAGFPDAVAVAAATGEPAEE